MDNNQRLKAICISLRLSRGDIVAACKAGGYNASHEDVKHWSRGAGKELDRGLECTPKGYTDYKPMPNAAFDAFCLGVRVVRDKINKDSVGNR